MTAAWIVRRIARDVRRFPGRPLALALAFFLLCATGGMAALGADAAAAGTRALAEHAGLIAYLDDDAAPQDGAALAEALRRMPGVLAVREVSSDEALDRLRRAADALGPRAAALGALEPGFLPRSIEIRLAPSPDPDARAADLARRLRGVPGISGVDAMSEGIAHLGAWQRAWWWLARAAIACALGAATAIVVLALGGAAGPRRVRARVLSLLGETRLHIRLPEVAIGAAAGIAGSGLAVLFLSTGFPILCAWLAALAGAPAVAVAALPARDIVLAVGGTAFIGAAVGWHAVPLPGTRDA